jgi:hypothetical protein
MSVHVVSEESLDDKDLQHIGVKRRSGRYPWGSGGEMLNAIDELSAKGLSETEIAQALGMKTTELRNQKTLAKAEIKEGQRIAVTRMKEAGDSVESIARQMKLPPSTVRDLLRPAANMKFRIIRKIADILKKAVEQFKYIDIGDGVEQYIGFSSTKLRNAVTLLQNEGYTVHYLREMQLGTGKRTSIKVLAAPGTEFKEVAQNKDQIQIPRFYTDNGGQDFTEKQSIVNIGTKGIQVVYDEDGGGKRDGLIEIRPGIPELSLGSKRYAQVRIGVDGDSYLKGMAVHSDNLPPGVNIRFHTSKKRADAPSLKDVLKGQKEEETSPFGAIVTPYMYRDENGEIKQSAINMLYDEGSWSGFSKSLASQFLSKQDPRVAKEQLDIAYDRRKAEFDEIMSLENPIVKEHLLRGFADAADSDAVVLKAAAMPRQETSVLLPTPSLNPGEVYAPNFKNGERILLVRYPHGGRFEIPELVVNNNNKEARSLMGSAIDAIGVNPETAQRLSGADFDGDFVLTLPADKRLRTSPALEELKNFDPHVLYKGFEGMPTMTAQQKQRQMGDVSNLIADMTIKGATQAEIAAAVRHSMVVIDAEKHGLNYRQSYIDNNIAALKTRYQGSARAGASTLLSKATSPVRVPHRKDSYDIDPVTGKKVFTYTDQTYINKKGEEVARTTKSRRLYEVDDASELSSGTQIERVYANYSNQMKKLGDQARLATVKIEPIPYSPQAKKTYANEVASLNKKLNIALRNSPLERKAQVVANVIYQKKLAANPGMSTTDKRSARGKSLLLARDRVGAKKEYISFTKKEWEAIQMGAISPTKLRRMLRNADMDEVKSLATPRVRPPVSTAQTKRARQLLDMGYTVGEIAQTIGLSANQINNALYGDDS